MSGWCRDLARSERQASNFVDSFLEVEGLTHSLLDAIFDQMLSTRSIVDAIVIRVLPREVAQAVKIPTALESTELGWECRQGAASG